MSLPKISIVTPSYNQAEYIEQAIQSVLDQDYPDKEYIIIDGGSTDGSVEIIKKYEKHLKYWISEPDNGQSHAINKGLTKITGNVFNWLNSDDYFNPGTFKKVAYSFQENNCDIACGKINYIGNYKFKKPIDETQIWQNNIAKTAGIAKFCQPAMFFKKKIIDELGPLNVQLQYAMDREWWVKYLLYFGTENTLKIEDVLLNFRLHGNSKTIAGSNPKFYKDVASIYYSLAKKFNLNEYSDLIEKEHEVLPDYEINLNQKFNISKNLVEKTLNYFLIEFGNYLFFKEKIHSAKNCARAIKDSFIKGDKIYKRKLLFKSSSPVVEKLYKMWHGKSIKYFKK